MLGFVLILSFKKLREPAAVVHVNKTSVQFSSVTQLCPILCNPMKCSTPGLPVHHQLLKFTQTHVPSSRWCHPAISSSIVPFSSCPQSLPASESFPMSQLFTWGGQSTGVSALASFLPKNTQGWSPSEWRRKDWRLLSLFLLIFTLSTFLFSFLSVQHGL